MASRAVTVVEQQPSDTRADGPQAHDRHFRFFHSRLRPSLPIFPRGPCEPRAAHIVTCAPRTEKADLPATCPRPARDLPADLPATCARHTL